LAKVFEREGIRTRRLAVSRAFHSALMEPMLDKLERMAGEVSYSAPRLALVSNVTGEVAGDEVTQPSYWRRHARLPVQFAGGMGALHKLGHRVFVELGPHPTLLGMGRACVLDEAGVWVASMRRGREDWRELLGSVAALYARGVDVDWTGFDRDYARSKVALPTYPFERVRYWLSDGGAAGDPAADGLDSWLYELTWVPPSGAAATDGPAKPGRWLILTDAGGLGRELARLLRERGDVCTLVGVGRDYSANGDGTIRIDPVRPDHLRRLCAEAVSPADPTPIRIVHLWGLDAPASAPDTAAELQAAAEAACAGALHVAQALLENGPNPPARLSVVTRGAQAVLDGEAPVLTQALLWGLGRGIAIEHPGMWGGLLDLDPTAPAGEAERLLAALEQGEGEDQVALRENGRLVARLVRRAVPAGAPVRLSAEATYLVTGGLGGLGLNIARWLVERGARHLALVGRQLPSGPRAEAVKALQRSGASVRTFAADAADPSRMAAVVAELKAGAPPLRGVVHAAGVLRPQPVREISADTLAHVLRPKVAGAWTLHEVTRESALDFFVAFSSGAALWGSHGLAHYAAANHFLDALAHHRKALGRPALSVNWGPWSGGMTTAEAQRVLAGMGMGALSVDDGLRALDRLLGAGLTQAAVAKVDWAAFGPVYSAKVRRRLLEQLEVAPEGPAALDAGDLLRQLEQALPGDRRDLLSVQLQAEAARVLGLGASVRLEAGQGFNELGLDSLLAVELRNRLQRRLGHALPSTLAFDHPTIHSLAAYLLDDVLALASESRPPAAVGDDELAALETLSDSEVKKLIAEELRALSTPVWTGESPT
jgi:acyl transferase domain-containing protein